MRSALLLVLLACAAPVAAQEHTHAGHDMSSMAGMDMEMPMHGLLGAYPMSRDASGTSWQPDAVPMDGIHFARGKWMGMLHGYVTAATADTEGPRGGADSYVESMFMAMAQRPLGSGTLGLRAMASLDPWTMGKEGYKLLLQTGETADGHEHLVDRQHPHDALMELAATWSRPVGKDASVFVYAGLPGEPALGPPAFMHRYAASGDPEAPLGHHWLDATHITFGVVTAGWTQGNVKFEASKFNGREPDENRTDIEVRRLDSWSARASWNPGPHWALQASHGHLDSPEQLEPDVAVDRTTASATYHRALPDARGQWQATLAWGRNRKHPGNTTDAWLLESALGWKDAWMFYGRLERTAKDELFDHDSPLAGETFEVSKLTLGAMRDIAHIGNIRFGVGAQFSQHWLPAALDEAYGDDPSGWLLFLRASLSTKN